jgi:transcriptional regulator with XRE-family HTH domain
VDPLNKARIGQRIKHLRKGKGLRQWQMAELLGATQPAVHKYENGILPEVKRLMEIARIGNTSVEWILTGRHWENGSEEMARLEHEVYDLAYSLNALSPEDRRILGDALEVLHATVAALRTRTGKAPPEMDDAELGRVVKALQAQTLGPLLAAIAVHDAVVTTLTRSKVRELHRFGHAGSEHVQRPAPVSDVEETAG